MTFNLCEPSKGNALHTHPAVEVFIALDGRWEIAWGETGQHKVVLQPWDMVVVPAHVRHSYKNVEEQTAQNIMTILPGIPAICWAPNVVSEAREHGARCTNRGHLLDFWRGEQPPSQCGGEDTQSVEAESEEEAADYHVPLSPAEMAQLVYRFREGRELRVTAAGAHLQIGWRSLAPKEELLLGTTAGDAACDLLLVVLEGTLMLSTTPGGEMFAVASRLDAVCVPAQAVGGVSAANRLAAPCTFMLVESQMRPLVDRQCEDWRIGDSPAPEANKPAGCANISPNSTMEELPSSSPRP